MKAIPDDIHRFLLANIDSVEQLEILLLLHREHDRSWTPDAVAQALYSQPSSVARRLGALEARGLLANADADAGAGAGAGPGGNAKADAGAAYRYAPKNDAAHDTVARLAEAYRQRRVAVITVIASKPMENVRAFSDAFRLRKREGEE